MLAPSASRRAAAPQVSTGATSVPSMKCHHYSERGVGRIRRNADMRNLTQGTLRFAKEPTLWELDRVSFQQGVDKIGCVCVLQNWNWSVLHPGPAVHKPLKRWCWICHRKWEHLCLLLFYLQWPLLADTETELIARDLDFICAFLRCSGQVIPGL